MKRPIPASIRALLAKRVRIKADIAAKHAEHKAVISGMRGEVNATTEAISEAIAAEDANAVQVMVQPKGKPPEAWVATRCSRSSLWARPIGKEDGERRFRLPSRRAWHTVETWDCKEASYHVLDADAVAAVAALEAE